jgi:hypothetical protein
VHRARSHALGLLSPVTAAFTSEVIDTTSAVLKHAINDRVFVVCLRPFGRFRFAASARRSAGARLDTQWLEADAVRHVGQRGGRPDRARPSRVWRRYRRR